MKVLRFIMYSLFFTLVAGALLLFFSPQIPFGPDAEVKIVKSGSMEPTIMTGAAVLIAAESVYEIGDVITFTDTNASIPTTHRIITSEVREGETVFITQGDANEEPDIAPVYPRQIIGRAVLATPYVGFIFDFARQPLGFALLVGIPALLIIIDEVEKIIAEIRRRRQKTVVTVEVTPALVKELNEFRASDLRFIAIFSLSVSAIAIAGLTLSGTLAFARDTEMAQDNRLTATVVDVALSLSTSSATFIGGGVWPMAPVALYIEESDSDPRAVYRLSVETVGGTQAFCESLEVDISDAFAYSGGLLALASADFSATAIHTFVSFDSRHPYSSTDTCVVDFILRASLAGEEEGYVDEERARFTLAVASGVAPARLLVSESEVSADVVARGTESEGSHDSEDFPEVVAQNGEGNDLEPGPVFVEETLEDTSEEEGAVADHPEAVEEELDETTEPGDEEGEAAESSAGTEVETVSAAESIE